MHTLFAIFAKESNGSTSAPNNMGEDGLSTIKVLSLMHVQKWSNDKWLTSKICKEEIAATFNQAERVMQTV